MMPQGSKQPKQEKIVITKFVKERGNMKVIGRWASGQPNDVILECYNTYHLLFTGTKVGHFAKRMKAMCTLLILQVSGGCDKGRAYTRDDMFEVTQKMLYASPEERIGIFGTADLLQCLVVHMPENGCGCGTCGEMQKVVEIISLEAKRNYVGVSVQCEIPCVSTNTLVRFLKEKDHMVGQLPCCRVYYVATERDPLGRLQEFMFMQWTNGSSGEGGSVVVDAGDLHHGTLHEHCGNSTCCYGEKSYYGTSEELEKSLLEMLESRSDLVVVYDDFIKHLNRPLCVDLAKLYSLLPRGTIGVNSCVKMTITMSETVTCLQQRLLHDTGSPKFILGAYEVEGLTTAWRMCAIAFLDKVRNLVQMCLARQRMTCVPVQHETGSGGERAAIAIRNNLVLACKTCVVFGDRGKVVECRLSGPCRFRDKFACVRTNVVLCDFKSFFPTMVIAFGLSTEVGSGGLGGTMDGMMRIWMQERTNAKQQIMDVRMDQTLTQTVRMQQLAKLETHQQLAKYHMNVAIGIWACRGAGTMCDLQLANRVYAKAKYCLQYVLDVLSEFATCEACGCTHRFEQGLVCVDGCTHPIQGTSVQVLETITDSVAFVASPNDSRQDAQEITNYIQNKCFASNPPVEIELTDYYSIIIFPNRSSTFGLPLDDEDACLCTKWVTKGPLLNPGAQTIYGLYLIRGIFATIACKILQNFPLTARVAEEMVIRSIKKLGTTLSEFHCLMQHTRSVCSVEIQATVRHLYEPHCMSDN